MSICITFVLFPLIFWNNIIGLTHLSDYFQICMPQNKIPPYAHDYNTIVTSTHLWITNPGCAMLGCGQNAENQCQKGQWSNYRRLGKRFQGLVNHTNQPECPIKARPDCPINSIKPSKKSGLACCSRHVVDIHKYEKFWGYDWTFLIKLIHHHSSASVHRVDSTL